MSKYCVCHGEERGEKDSTEGRRTKEEQTKRDTHTHTHTHPAPRNTSPERARPRCPPHRTCKTGGGGRGEEAGKTGRQTDKDREMGE